MARVLASISTLFALALVSGCASKGMAAGSDGGDPQGGVCASDKTGMPFIAHVHSTGPNGVTVGIVATPPEATATTHTFMLTVTGGDAGGPIEGATVTVVCKMTHLGSSHGCTIPLVTAKDMGGGVYEAKQVIPNMTGHWVITVKVGTLDQVPFDEVPFNFCFE